MGLYSVAKHLGPFLIYLTGIILFFRGLAGDGRWALALAAFIIPLKNVFDKLLIFPLANQFIDMLCVAGLVGCLSISAKEKRPFPCPSTLNIIIIISIIYTFISLFIGNNNLHGTCLIDLGDVRVKDWKNFCLLMPMLFFITLNHVTDRKWMLRILMAMLVGFIVVDYYTLNQIREFSNLISREKIRGTFELGTNELAAFFNEYTLIMLSVAFFMKRKLVKWALLGLVAINIFCILNLYSRGAYLGLFAGMAFLFCFKNRKFLIPLVLLAVFWQVILPENVIKRIKMTVSDNGELDASSQTRVDVWKESFALFEKSPMTGIGFGVFRSLGLELGDTHNIYVKYLVEQGLIGLIIFLVFLFCFLRMGWVLYKKGEDDLSKSMGLGLMSCIIVVIINNFFGDRWSYLEISAYIWIYAGLVARLTYSVEHPSAVPETGTTDPVGASASDAKLKKKVRYYDL